MPRTRNVTDFFILVLLITTCHKGQVTHNLSEPVATCQDGQVVKTSEGHVTSRPIINLISTCQGEQVAHSLVGKL